MGRLGLPSAARTVRKSISVCRRMGYDQDQALHLIQAALINAINMAAGLGDTDPAWLRAVYVESVRRYDELRPKTTPPSRRRGQPEEFGA